MKSTHIVLLIILTNALFAQNSSERGYPLINNYSPKEYGADTQNWAILQDNRGVMYFGNNLGLLEFDGADWRLYSLPNNTTVRSLANGEDSKIYTGGVGDLGYFSPDSTGKLIFHSLLPFVPRKNQDFSDVWQVFVNGTKVYFNVSSYILIWDIETKQMRAIEGDDSFHLIFLVEGTLYVREWGKGLLKLESDSLHPITGGEQFANERIYVMLPFPDEPGTSLIVTRNMGFFKYDGISFMPFKTEIDDHIKQNLIYAPGVVLNDGNILLGTLNDGAVVIDRYGKELQRYNRESGIISTVVYFQFQDKSGAIWLPTDNGISRIDYASQVSYFDSRNNFSTTAYEIIRHKGTIYAATNNGVYYLDTKTSNFYQLPGVNYQAFDFEQSGDDLLAGTLQGLLKVDKNGSAPIRESLGNEYGVNSFRHSLVHPERLYIGAQGLWSLVKNKNTWIDEGQLLDIEDVVNSIEEEKNGTLWVGTNSSGVFKITPKTDKDGTIVLDEPLIEKYDHEDGLPIGGLFVKKLNDENYFLAAESFYRFDEQSGTFYLDNTYKVVSSLQLYISPTNIKEDNLRRLWISLGREPALGTPQPDGSYQWQTTPFKRFANEIIVSIYPEDNGVVWFSSSSSIIRYDLTKNNIYNSDYTALVRHVQIGADSTIYFGGAIDDQSIPKISFADNSIKFVFAAPSFEDETANQFKTYLEGFEDDWSDWSKVNRKEYTNLPPGKYTFHVTAKNVFEIESEEATYAFTILPPWYRTTIAYIFFALLIFGFGFLIDRLQRKRLLAKTQARMKIQAAEHRAESAELQAQAAEAQALVIQAENERKSRELEEARQLQLSMLPKEIPQLPHLDIAVYMKTATEVGGDFYDFSLKEDGSVNIAIGDATGHGMKAGTMVSSMKSIFTTNSVKMDIEEFFLTANKGIKSMQLPHVMMAFALLNVKNNNLKIVNAGMPPLFYYQQQKNRVIEIEHHAAPLGALKESSYKSKQVNIVSGDTLLLLSDGMPELENSSQEMYGYDRLRQDFESIAEKDSKEIIHFLKEQGSAWVNDEDPGDDVTFVVIKVK